MTDATSNDIRHAIADANRRFMGAFESQDAAGVAACYTRDAQLLPPNADVVSGTQAIEGFWRFVMNLGIAKATLESIEIESDDDVVREIGRYALIGAGGAILDRGKYLVVWKCENGRWILHRDIWNSGQPAG